MIKYLSLNGACLREPFVRHCEICYGSQLLRCFKLVIVETQDEISVELDVRLDLDHQTQIE